MALLVALPENALVDNSGVFPVNTSPWFSILIYHLEDGGCSSEIYSHPINIIIIICKSVTIHMSRVT
jgi:hypothetical protein